MLKIPLVSFFPSFFIGNNNMLSGITDCPKKKKKKKSYRTFGTPLIIAAGSFRWRIRLLVAGDKLDIVTSNIKFGRFGLSEKGSAGCRGCGYKEGVDRVSTNTE